MEKYTIFFWQIWLPKDQSGIPGRKKKWWREGREGGEMPWSHETGEQQGGGGDSVGGHNV